MADEFQNAVAATPMSLETFPEMCALGPDMDIISCYAGHGHQDEALNDIRRHAGI